MAWPSFLLLAPALPGNVALEFQRIRCLDVYLNIYRSLVRGGADTRDGNLHTVHWFTLPSSLCCGEFNAHSAAWDPVFVLDDVGNQMEDWASSNGSVSSTLTSPPTLAPTGREF